MSSTLVLWQFGRTQLVEATAAGVYVNGYTNGRENVSKRLQLAYILTVSVQGNKFKHLEQKMSEPIGQSLNSHSVELFRYLASVDGLMIIA